MKSAIVCGDFDRLLSAYVDHEASPNEMRLVEEHARQCQACSARLRRMQRLAPQLDLQLQALLSAGERQARGLNRSFRPPPELMLTDAASTPFLMRLSTVAIVLVLALLVGAVLLRSAPTGQSVQTAAPPAAPPPPSGRYVGVSIDGLVDPPTVQYVQRALAAAEQQRAPLLVWLSPSAGLDSSVQAIEADLATSDVPTYAYSAAAPNATSAALSSSVSGTLDAMPAGAAIEWLQMDALEAVWHRVLDPTTAYLFFVLGLYAILVEIAHPGALVPGITGALCLALAAVAFATLPTNWLGVGVLVAGVGLMAVELKAAKHGWLLLGGVVCLGLGSLMLYALPGSLAPALNGVVVAPAVLLGIVVVGVVSGVVLVRLAQRVQRLPPLMGWEQLIGARGIARTELHPDGVVHVRGQLWSAHARGGPIAPGELVRVLARRGLVLEVESASRRAAATQKGANW